MTFFSKHLALFGAVVLVLAGCTFGSPGNSDESSRYSFLYADYDRFAGYFAEGSKFYDVDSSGMLYRHEKLLQLASANQEGYREVPLQLCDPITGVSTEISFEDAQKLTLDPTKISPDGYFTHTEEFFKFSCFISENTCRHSFISPAENSNQKKHIGSWYKNSGLEPTTKGCDVRGDKSYNYFIGWVSEDGKKDGAWSPSGDGFNAACFGVAVADTIDICSADILTEVEYGLFADDTHAIVSDYPNYTRCTLRTGSSETPLYVGAALEVSKYANIEDNFERYAPKIDLSDSYGYKVAEKLPFGSESLFFKRLYGEDNSSYNGGEIVLFDDEKKYFYVMKVSCGQDEMVRLAELLYKRIR